jgi:hypothetical protein
MKKTYCRLTASFFILASISFSLDGQDIGQESLFSQVRTLELRNLGNKSYSDIEGTPYFSNNSIESVVYFRDGNYASVPLRWDIFRDEMEFTKDSKMQWIIKKKVNFIKFGNDTMLLVAAEADTSKPNYYLLKDNGEIKLFYRKVAKFYPYERPQAYKASIPDRFLPDNDIIFMKKDNQSPVRILTKKDLLGFFSGNEKALKFIKSHKTSPDDIEDLHVLLSYLKKDR